MKSYIITKFQILYSSASSWVNYTLDSYTGFYNSNTLPSLGLNDLFTLNGTICIDEIRRSDNTIFHRGTQFIANGTTNPELYSVLTRFEIVKNKMYFVDNNSNHYALDDVDLREKLLEKLKQQKEAVTKAKTNVVKNSNELQLLEERIIKSFPEAIRLKGLLKNRGDETLSQFIENFFKSYNSTCETIFKESMNKQCDPGKRRSVGDIFMICRYYYPKCTLIEILNELYNVLPKKLKGFRTSKCGVIKKKVWYYNPARSNDVINTEMADEYGNNYQWYLDKLKNE